MIGAGSPPASGGDAAPRTLTDLQDCRVLVVDDNRVNRHLLLALLERGGFRTVDSAEDGADALARLDSFRPDLILLDLMMPRMDGFEMCRRLRADPAWAHLPVLVQSSLNRAEDRAKAFAAGATDYVTKPLNALELLARVRIHLQNQALLRDLTLFRSRTEAELDLARTMQERLMPGPDRCMTVEAQTGIAINAHFAPSSELGGDFWGLREDPDTNGRLQLYLVDFSGHGVGAALNTFRLHAILLQIRLDRAMTPADILEILNKRLCALLPRGQFATMLIGEIDPETGCFRYASAGSTKPMVWGPDDTAPAMGDSAGLPLGLLEQATYENRELPLPPGGRLFLYSDAAIEIPLGADVLDESGLATLIQPHLHDPDGGRFLSTLDAALHATGPIDDDLTALLFTRRR